MLFDLCHDGGRLAFFQVMDAYSTGSPQVEVTSIPPAQLSDVIRTDINSGM